MRNSELSFLVVGAGAVGGITAALLRKNGVNVEILCRHQDYATKISTEGVNVSGTCGSFSIKIPAYSDAGQVKSKKDIILLATKATDMLQATKDCLSVLKDDGYIVSMQNGICEDAIAEIAGNERVIGCVTGWGATLESPGNLIMTSKGDFIIGYRDRQPDELLDSLKEILSAVVPVKTSGNIMGHLYSKLIINSCITSLGALCGMYLGKMLLNLKARKIFIEIIREAVAVADSMNLKIEVFGGKLDFKKFIMGTGLVSDLRRHVLLLIIGYKYRRLKSSSLQSLERGKQTEIDYLNGYIVQNGLRNGVSVPVNKMIVSMIHDIENGSRTISERNFDEPFFSRIGS